MDKAGMGRNIYQDPIIRELTENLVKATNLEEKTETITIFCSKYRGRYLDFQKELLADLLRDVEKANNPLLLGSIHNAYSWIFIDSGQYEKAIDSSRRSQEQFSLAGAKRREVLAINAEASAIKTLGHLDKALNRYLDGLQQAKELGDFNSVGIFLRNLGGLMTSMGQYDEAIAYYQEEIKSCPLQKGALAAQSYMMGNAYHLKGDYKEAEPLFRTGLTHSIEQGDLYLEGLCSFRLGEIQIFQGQTEAGEVLIKRALEISESEKIPTLRSLALGKLAENELARDNYQLALDYVTLATEILKETKTQHTLPAKLLLLAEVYHAMQDYETAYRVVSEARQREVEQFNEQLLNSLKVAKAKQIRRENTIYKDLYERIGLISRVGQTITSTFEVEQIGQILWDNLKELMPINTVAIGLHNKESDDLEYKIFIQNGRNLPAVAQPFVLEDTNCSFLSAPLSIQNKTIGIIVVQSQEEDAYQTHHEDILRTLAAYVAIALENGRLVAHITELASVDALTGLYNRRFALEMAKKEFHKAKRYQTPLSVILLDMDGLKRVNDTFGHAAGDQFLQEAARVFSSGIRDCDVASRVGGDEFLLILPQTEYIKAEMLAERLLANLGKVSFLVEGSSIQLRASLGVTEVTLDDEDIEQTIARADKLLYGAKQSGGNLVRSGVY